MRSHSVKMLVNASVPLECEFRPENEGWIAECQQARLEVRGSDFEDAKRAMEMALQEYLTSVLRDRGTLAA